jgi:DNA invertase Pin-like site-specific DNA recombinase
MRAIIYCRQSKDREEGIADQAAKCTALVRARGWDLVHVPFTDNDVSATSGKRRPGYERAMQMVRSNQVDVLVVSVMDRLYRKVVELEHIIPLMESTSTKVAAVGGEYDLSTDTGRLVARILASVAQGEVETKARRQRDANVLAATAGKRWKSSQRPFGWSADDYTVPVEDEARAIAEGCRMVLAGGTVSGVVRTWVRMGVRPAQAPFGPLTRNLTRNPWTRQSVLAILRNPAIAGMRRYRGEIVSTGGWTGIVTPEVFSAVQSILSDPSRKTSKGVRSLLGGIAKCTCGHPVVRTNSSKGHQVYKCSAGLQRDRSVPHVSIKASMVDAFITEVIISRMSKADAVTLLAADSPVDLQALRDEASAIRSNVDTLAADMALGIIPRRAYLAAAEKASKRLEDIDQAVMEGSREHVASELVSAPDVRKAWDGLDLSRQRAVIRSLVTITLHSVGRGCRVPDPERSFAVGWAA